MSAFAFGKVVSDRGSLVADQILGMPQRCQVQVVLDGLLPEDSATFEEAPELRRKGVCFDIRTPGEPDATALCIEAMDCGMKSLSRLDSPFKWNLIDEVPITEEIRTDLSKSRLGCFVLGLFDLEGAAFGLAIFDNAIDSIVSGDRDSCREALLRTLLIPWDRGPNTLYVWT